jgi:hydroxymethylpyrimidine pyrophosphatase-like HAD family hydrolase
MVHRDAVEFPGQNVWNPVVSIELDGVLNMWTGQTGEYDAWLEIRAGATNFIEALRQEGWDIVVVTHRPMAEVHQWLERMGLSSCISAVTRHAPPAKVHISPRAVCFNGDLGETLGDVMEFVAHWEKVTSVPS